MRTMTAKEPPMTPMSKRKKWAYVYHITPFQSIESLVEVKRLVDEEMAEARKNGLIWQARFIPNNRITHLLIVTDSPDQGRSVNRDLEKVLIEIKATFVRSVPFLFEGNLDLEHPDVQPLLNPLLGPTTRTRRGHR